MEYTLYRYLKVILSRAFRAIKSFLQDEILQLGAIVYFVTHLPLFLVYNMLL